jgi:hypothetical protein
MEGQALVGADDGLVDGPVLLDPAGFRLAQGADLALGVEDDLEVAVGMAIEAGQGAVAESDEHGAGQGPAGGGGALSAARMSALDMVAEEDQADDEAERGEDAAKEGGPVQDHLEGSGEGRDVGPAARRGRGGP